MVEQTSHRNSLFFSTGKNIVPIVDGIEPTLTVLQVLQLNILQQFGQVRITDLILMHHKLRLWVYDLVAKCSRGEIWSLWDVEQLIHVRSM